MDEYSRSRRASSGLFPSKRGSGFSVGNTSNNKNQNIPVCSRVGCSSRMSSSSRTLSGFSNKSKCTKQPFRLSTNGNEIIGSSSKPSSSSSGPRKLGSDHQRKFPSEQATDLESSNLQDKSHLSEPILTRGSYQVRLNSQPKVDVCGESTSQEASSSSSLTCHSKKAAGKYELCDQTTPVCSSTSLPFRNGRFGARNGASTSRYTFKNLKCGLISDVVPSGCSSSAESSHGERRPVGRKRNVEAESSFSVGEKMMNGARVDARKVNVSHSGGISISDSRRAQNFAPSRRDNNNSTSMGTGSSIRTQRSTARARLTKQENRNRLQCTDSSILGPRLTQPDMLLGANGSNSEYQFPAQSSSSRASFSDRPGSSRESMCSGRTVAPLEVGYGRSFTSRESLRQYNLGGIAEMLLALDRIEQDDELTYEQLLVLETNLFLGGASFHDRHRDMRLDIDNMSYEELLALEERMGIVSTALTEEALEQCLEKSIFQGSLTEGSVVVGVDDDDVKCSICQEEYIDGDQVGRLGCEHRYHVECVSQWLRLKNWCPICKTSAQSSESLSSSSPPSAGASSSPFWS